MSSPQMTAAQAIEGMPPIDTPQVEAMRERLVPMLQQIVDARTEAFRQGRSLAEVPHPFQMPTQIDFGTLAVLTRDLSNARRENEALRFTLTEKDKEIQRLRTLLTPVRPASGVEGLARPPAAGGAAAAGEGELRPALAAFVQSVTGGA